MDFFDKLGKKATEAYKVTADKTGKIAKETKLKLKMSELKSTIEDIYEDIGKKVYEKHVKKEEISKEDVLEECNKIDEISNDIEKIRKECLQLKDKKQCTSCYKEIDKTMKFCPECGAKQEEVDEAETIKNVEELQDNQVENSNLEEDNKNKKSEDFNKESMQQEEKEKDKIIEETKTNLEKTTEIEINPDTQDITEKMKNVGNEQ